MPYTIPPKKMLIINILDILRKYSDENHRLSAKEIGEILKRDYAQTVDRKAIKRNLMNLLDFGYDIEYTEIDRKSAGGETETILTDWYINREFTDPELRLLIDSLLFSKRIPYEQCRALIAKLEGLSNIHFKAKARHIYNMPEHLPENKELFYTIDVLDEAITAGRMVAFQYTEYGTDKKPHPRKNKNGVDREYKVSPYQMAATNGRYYLICHLKHMRGLSNYRVDRIVGIRLLEDKALPLNEITGMQRGLDLPKHMAEHIYMFTGESVLVKFRAARRVVGDILDWFDKDVAFSDETEAQVTVTVSVNAQAMFYWALQYGEHVEVLEPEALRSKLREASESLARKYQA